MYEAKVESWGDTRTVATTRHASFVMDTKGKGANPVDAMLAALCACLGHYVHDFLEERGIRGAGFTVAAQAASAPDQSRLASIDVEIDLGQTRLGAAGETELLAYVEGCKIHGTLRRGCPVDVAVKRPVGAPAEA